MEINGFKLSAPLTCDKSGFSKWGFAGKDGKQYFIKEFLSPIYPVKRELLSEEQIMSKIKICKNFEKEKSRLYKDISECSNGNIVPVSYFFRHESHYYIVTEKINACPLSVSEISAMSDSQKLIIMKIIAYSLGLIHSKGIVHGDIKPDNILFSKTPNGIYTAKLIDFDSSFFADSLPEKGEDFQGDLIYLAPESYLYMAGEETKITPKADVFALGVMFHLFWCGELPYFNKEEYDYAFEAVLSDEKLLIYKTVPRTIAVIISQMLEKDPNARPSLSSVFMALAKIELN
ncbi:MAG: hypothetical protein E7415_01075 [Ruminococcaceae bacterium]|nr:hypothetical protein [Oscillospiraceae bacterium]